MPIARPAAAPFSAAPFALATLGPVPLLIVAAQSGGGIWVAVAAAVMALGAVVLDRVIAATPAAEGAGDAEFPAATALSVTLALLHLPVLALGVDALARATSPATAAGLWLAFGLWLGQIGNANAHELIHRPGPGLRALGVAVYVSLLFGHHASAHRLVHHRAVATDADPNTARLGEGFWRFWPRAWAGSFRAGLAAERARDGQRRGGALANPYVAYLGGAALCLGAAGMWRGWAGVGAYLALAGHAQMQLLLSDYVQHYGLRRATLPDGRTEPVGLRHSWNAAAPVSGWQLLRAPRHGDHHLHPLRAFPALALPDADAAPRLPRALPAMATLALVPPLWRRVMDRRAARWRPPADPPVPVPGNMPVTAPSQR